MHWRRKWQPTPVFLSGESQGRGSLVGCCLWGHGVGHDWSDLAAAAAVPDIRKLQGVLSEPESAPSWETDAISCLNSPCHKVIAGQGDLNKQQLFLRCCVSVCLVSKRGSSASSEHGSWSSRQARTDTWEHSRHSSKYFSDNLQRACFLQA